MSNYLDYHNILYIDSNGKVGVNSNTPLATLSLVSGEGNASGHDMIRMDSPDPTILFNDTTNTGSMRIRWQAGSGASQGLRFFRDGDDGSNPALMIDLNGNVGVKRVPSSGGDIALDVAGDSRITSYMNTLGDLSQGLIFSPDIGDSSTPVASKRDDYTPGVIFGYGAGKSALVGLVDADDHDGMGLAFLTHPSGTGADDSVEAMRIERDGDVGIGTNRAGAQLHVNESLNGVNAGLLISNYNTTAGASQQTRLLFGLARNSGSLKSTAGEIRVGKEQDWTNDDTTLDSYMSFHTFRNMDSHEQLRITSDGWIGIGVTNPSSILELGGDPSPEITFNDSTANDRGSLEFQDGNFSFWSNYTNAGAVGGNATKHLTILKNGNVGIGIDTPSNGELSSTEPRLHVHRTGTNGKYDLVARFQAGNDADNTGASILINHANDRGLLIEAGRQVNDSSIAHLGLLHANATLTRGITLYKPVSTGIVNVGIGNTNPSSNLHIGSSTSDSQWIRLSTQYGDFSIGNGSVNTPPKKYFSIYDNDASLHRLWVSDNGNVGIGTTDPLRKLHVLSTSTTDSHYDAFTDVLITDTDARLQIMSEDDGNNGSAVILSTENKHWYMHSHVFGMDYRFSIGYEQSGANNVDCISDGDDYFNILKNGNVGIGTTGPSYKLSVNGTGYFSDAVTFVKGMIFNGNEVSQTEKHAGADFGNDYLLKDTTSWTYPNNTTKSNAKTFTFTAPDVAADGTRYYVKFLHADSEGGARWALNGYGERILSYNDTPGNQDDNSLVWTTVDITDQVQTGTNTLYFWTNTGDGVTQYETHVFTAVGLALPNEPVELKQHFYRGLTTSGSIGINTTSPATALEVAGNVRINGGDDYGSQLVQWCDNNGHAGIAAFDLTINNGQNSSRTSTMFFSSDGKVGIGTTDPQSPLTVAHQESRFGTENAGNLWNSTNPTRLVFQDYGNFWIGAGNGTWFTGAANTKTLASGMAADISSSHDLLLTTMYSDATTHDRGITFAVADNGATGGYDNTNTTSGWRLGKWHSGVSQATSQFVVDGGLSVKGGHDNMYDYYGDDYSTYHNSQGASSAWKITEMVRPSIMAAGAIQIQSGNKTNSTVNPELQFHQHGYGGPRIRYDGPGTALYIESPKADGSWFDQLVVKTFVGNNETPSLLTLHADRTDVSAAAGVAIQFVNKDDNNNPASISKIKSIANNETLTVGDNNESSSHLVFETANAGVLSDKVVITGAGNVGVGTMLPVAPLHIKGWMQTPSGTGLNNNDTEMATMSQIGCTGVFEKRIQFTRGTGSPTHYLHFGIRGTGSNHYKIKVLCDRHSNQSSAGQRDFGMIVDEGYVYWESDGDYGAIHHPGQSSSLGQLEIVSKTNYLTRDTGTTYNGLEKTAGDADNNDYVWHIIRIGIKFSGVTTDTNTLQEVHVIAELSRGMTESMPVPHVMLKNS